MKGQECSPVDEKIFSGKAVFNTKVNIVTLLASTGIETLDTMLKLNKIYINISSSLQLV